MNARVCQRVSITTPRERILYKRLQQQRIPAGANIIRPLFYGGPRQANRQAAPRTRLSVKKQRKSFYMSGSGIQFTAQSEFIRSISSHRDCICPSLPPSDHLFSRLTSWRLLSLAQRINPRRAGAADFPVTSHMVKTQRSAPLTRCLASSCELLASVFRHIGSQCARQCLKNAHVDCPYKLL